MEVPQPLPERLPQSESAVVKRDKVVHYLLNPSHPVGGPKARRFEEVLGYRREHSETLRNDLAAAAVLGTVTNCRPAQPRGLIWTLDVQLTGPNGRTARVRSTWQMLAPGVAPRLVSAWVDD